MVIETASSNVKLKRNAVHQRQRSDLINNNGSTVGAGSDGAGVELGRKRRRLEEFLVCSTPPSMRPGVSARFFSRLSAPPTTRLRAANQIRQANPCTRCHMRAVAHRR